MSPAFVSLKWNRIHNWEKTLLKTISNEEWIQKEPKWKESRLMCFGIEKRVDLIRVEKFRKMCHREFNSGFPIGKCFLNHDIHREWIMGFITYKSLFMKFDVKQLIPNYFCSLIMFNEKASLNFGSLSHTEKRHSPHKTDHMWADVFKSDSAEFFWHHSILKE